MAGSEVLTTSGCNTELGYLDLALTTLYGS
jgi:hypothetical protein